MSKSSGTWEVLFCAAAFNLAAAALAAAEAPAPFLAGIDPEDARALLEAGARLEEKGQASWALQCYRRVLKLGDGPGRSEATFRAARIELARKNYEAAYAMLREAAGKHGHAGAKALLEKAETAETRKQADLLERARQSLEKGDAAGARKLLADAHDLFPAQPTAAPFAPRREVLREMAKVRDLIDDEHYREKVQPLQGRIKSCKNCADSGGFIRCEPCEGAGTIRQTVSLGRQKKVIHVPCGACSFAAGRPGTGWVFCPPPCYGLGAYPETKKLGARETKAIIGVLNKVRSVKVLASQLPSALDTVESTLLRAEESASLDYLRALKPGYSFSRDLKKSLGAAPPDRKALADAAAPWKVAGRDARVRANFLYSYAIEFAGWLKPFEMLRAPRKRVDFRSPPLASRMAPEAVAPEILSADPEDMTSGWLAVEGVFEDYRAEGSDPTKGLLAVRGSVPHNVRFFVWLPAASGGLESLEKGPWQARLGGLAKAYPFDIHARASAIPRGHRVVLAGRFLRDRLGFPRNWFEVWDIRVGLSREMEQVFLALEDPVTEMELRGAKASELAGFLKVLHGIDVAWGPIDGSTRLDVSASGCPVGLAIDAVARALDATWHFEDGKVVFGRAAPGRDMTPVVAELAALERGSFEVKRSEAPAPSAPAAELPEAPAALEAMAASALGRMDYAVALECRDRLLRLAAAAGGEERAKVTAAREKARLFHELTRQTPVQSLVGAKELVRLKIRNRAGDTSEQTVRVLKRMPDSLTFQPGYGGEVGVKLDQVVAEKPIAGDAWRAGKRRELEERLGKLAGAAPREPAGELFLLALFAKTYDFRDRGTALLERAIASAEFDRVLATYFPRSSRDLSSAWRKATGRDAAAAARVEPAGAAEPGPAAASRLPSDEPIPEAPGQLLAFAKRHCDQGRAYFAQSLPGMDGAREKLLLARKHLENARDALDRLGPGDAGDPAVKRLRQDVLEGLLDCVKCLGFFD